MALRQQIAVTGRNMRQPYLSAINAAKGELWNRYANRENTRLQQESLNNQNKWNTKNYGLSQARLGLEEDIAERNKRMGLINTGIAAGGLGLNAYLGLKGANETADLAKNFFPAVNVSPAIEAGTGAVANMSSVGSAPSVGGQTGLLPQIGGGLAEVGGAIADLGKDAFYGLGEVGGAIDDGLRKIPILGGAYESAANAITSLGSIFS